jgi:uncharacterized protein YjbJ (UPF0337 family)
MRDNSTQMKFDAKVDDLRGRLKESWGALTDDDIDRADGQWDQVISTIREKTGDSVETISDRLNSMIDSLQAAGSRTER